MSYVTDQSSNVPQQSVFSDGEWKLQTLKAQKNTIIT